LIGATRKSFFAAAALAAALLIPGSASAATITPTAGSLTDEFTNNSTCSLREAISIANQDGITSEDICGVSGTLGDDTVVLEAATYLLSIDGTGDDTNANGDLDARTGVVGGDLTLQGAGSGLTTIGTAGFDDRIIDNSVVGGGNTLTIAGLKITGALFLGNQQGAGINTFQDGADIDLNDVVLTFNLTGGSGGGIGINGAASTLTLTNSRVGGLGMGEPNGATNNGGGIRANAASVTLNNSQVTGNGSARGGGISLASGASLVANGAATEINGNTAPEGAGIDMGTGDVTLNAGVSVHDNTATSATTPVEGAGIRTSTGVGTGDLTLNGASVEDNPATASDPADSAVGAGINYAGDGTVTLNGATISGNSTSGGAGFGAGVYIAAGGALVADSSTIADNTLTVVDNAFSVVSGAGAGVEVGGGTATLTRTTINSNDLVVNDPGDNGIGGAGIHSNASSLTLDSSTVSANTIAGNSGTRVGAGIANAISGTTRLLNSTVSDNLGGANSSGGGISQIGTDEMTIRQSTIAGNTATTGPGIFRSAGTATLAGSIVAQGAAACFGGGFTANAFNVDSGTSCVGAANDTDLEGLNASPISLADNGGPTMTRALPVGSAALNAVPAASCDDLVAAPLTVDQRGYPRPFPTGGNCDPGAYETYTCDGVALNTPGPFAGCPPPQGGGGTQGSTQGVCAGKPATITGTEGAETITGTAAADVIAAQGGNDTVRSLAGNDLVCGGAGNDRLIGGGGKDKLRGEAGKDKLTGGGGKDTCIGGGGKDKPAAASCEKKRSIP